MGIKLTDLEILRPLPHSVKVLAHMSCAKVMERLRRLIVDFEPHLTQHGRVDIAHKHLPQRVDAMS
jgi:hypothetical protein